MVDGSGGRFANGRMLTAGLPPVHDLSFSATAYSIRDCSLISDAQSTWADPRADRSKVATSIGKGMITPPL